MRLAWLLPLVQSAAALMSSSGETYTRRWRDSVFVCFEYAGVWHDGIEPFATLSTTDGALTGDNQCVTPLVGAFATSTSFPLHYHAANYKPCCEVPRFSGEATATLWDYDMWGSNDEVGAVTIDLNTLGEQSFTVRDGSGEAAPTWSERISGPGVAGTFNFRLLVTTDPNPSTSVGVCLRGSPQHMVGRRCGDASSLRAMAASAAISHVAPGPAPLLGGALVAAAALVALVTAARARRPRAAGAAALPMM